MNIQFLEALSNTYPNINSVVNQIARLSAVQKLPKETEHFLSDIHGEHEAFRHILNNASGVIREKIDQAFSTSLVEKERASLASLIYYPKEKLEELNANGIADNEWALITISKLITLAKLVSLKFPISEVIQAIPLDYKDMILELLYADLNNVLKTEYYKEVLHSLVEHENENGLIIALCDTIKKLTVNKLHIVGDIFDRGPRPDIIMDMLLRHHNVDIQWGNHDVLWMGAGAGSRTCILNALNIAIKYNNLDFIEIGYGISLRPLSLFANEVYSHCDCSCFLPKSSTDTESREQLARMHKAVAIMLFKLEGMIIMRNPNFQMENRLLLNHIDYKAKTVEIGGKVYELKDCDFPTINPDDPYQLSEQESALLKQLSNAFLSSEKLQKHIRFLYTNGSIYKVKNGNLLFHGCIPTNEDGSFTQFNIKGILLSGKAYMDYVESKARQGYYAISHTRERQEGKDFLWFLWAGANSPLFGRSRMTTFERLFIADKATHKEAENPYYEYKNDEAYVLRILADFGLKGPNTHIINGHVPVRVIRGEKPIHANGRLIVIDGGFCKAYQSQTGIAGYTLIYSSMGLRLISHEAFKGTAEAISNNVDIFNSSMIYAPVLERIQISETDKGAYITEQIKALEILLDGYRSGVVKERG